MKITEDMRQLLLRQKPRADSLLFLLSLLVLALFASNEVIAIQPNLLPVSSSEWIGVQLVARFTIWSCFVAHFVTYGMLSGKPWKYLRDHPIELVICLAWFPQQYNVSLLHDFTNLLSLETVELIGTLANGFLVVRHVVQNLRTHPLIVTGSAYLFVIMVASELLVKVEPQTFHSLFDALWYSMATTTTVGYGDIVPHTYLGRCIGIALMVSGISLAGALIGIVSQLMQRRLGQRGEEQELCELRERLSIEQSNNQRLVEALEKDNELKEKLVELLTQSKPK